MKIHTTNYQDTFIEIADDCVAAGGEVPPIKGTEKTIANMQFEMICDSPYKYTSDDVLFHCFAAKNKIANSELKSAREQFFSKGQPCFRASPLTKRYGFGIHSDTNGKVALYGCDTTEYKKLSNDQKLKVVKAMKSSK